MGKCFFLEHFGACKTNGAGLALDMPSGEWVLSWFEEVLYLSVPISMCFFYFLVSLFPLRYSSCWRDYMLSVGADHGVHLETKRFLLSGDGISDIEISDSWLASTCGFGGWNEMPGCTTVIGMDGEHWVWALSLAFLFFSLFLYTTLYAWIESHMVGYYR